MLFCLMFNNIKELIKIWPTNILDYNQYKIIKLIFIITVSEFLKFKSNFENKNKETHKFKKVISLCT